jgi:hypothetical protein
MNKTTDLGRLCEIRANMAVERLARQAFVVTLKRTVAEMRRAFALENQAARDAWLGRKLAAAKVDKPTKVAPKMVSKAKLKVPVVLGVLPVVHLVQEPEQVVIVEIAPVPELPSAALESDVVQVAELAQEPVQAVEVAQVLEATAELEAIPALEVAPEPETSAEPEVASSSETVHASDVAHSSDLSSAKHPTAARQKRRTRKHRPV